MKKLRVCTCLLVSGLLAWPSWAQEASDKKQADSEKEPAAQLSQKELPADTGKTKEKEAVPEKIIPEKEAIKQLIGDYRIVSGENSGEQVLPERLADVTVRITEKTITTYDGERQQRFSTTYRLDTQQRPWRIRMTSTPQPANAPAAPGGTNAASTASDGLIELADGRVKVIYALPGGTAPRAFQTADRQQMFVLEKLPDTTEKSKNATEASSPDKAKASENRDSKQD